MLRKTFGHLCRSCLATGLGLVLFVGSALTANAQEQFRATGRNDHRHQDVPRLSEATAILEAAVREMYQHIEPGRDTSPNELLAYADLRALRLYTGALEVAGWSLEQAQIDYQRYIDAGAYRGGRGRGNDPQSEAALERFRAYRETTRTLLYRVRMTAVSVEHQVSFCAPEVAREWRLEVLPALRNAIAATEPMFEEQVAYQGYGVPGQPTTRVVQTAATTGGIPRDAVDVSRNTTYAPYEGKARGQGRYFEIRAYGGPIHVRSIRFRSHENALGLLGTSVLRELNIDEVCEPGQPLYIPCNRSRMVDLSELEIEWDSAERGRRVYGTIDVIETTPNSR